jgi:hypothetical protein
MSTAPHPTAPRVTVPTELSTELPDEDSRGIEDRSVDDSDRNSETSRNPAVDHDSAANHNSTADPDADDGRAARAAAEPMTVRTLRDGRYVVETEGGTYVVALDDGTCTCPDHAIRGARCKHLRRVAMEVAAGAAPAPDERVAVCAVCGGEAFVPRDADGPQLCARHGFEPGALVRDRATREHLLVVAVTNRRADAYRTEEGRTIDEYDTNVEYGTHEPVVEAVYIDSLRPDREVGDAKRYGFPASRLTRNREKRYRAR